MLELYLIKRGIVLGIITLFIVGYCLPSLTGMSLMKNNQPISLQLRNYESVEKSVLTCVAFGKTREITQEVTLAQEEATMIFDMVEELKSEMTQHPLSERTQVLKNAFVDLLDQKGLIPKGISKETYLSILSPPWSKPLQHSGNNKSVPRSSSNLGTCALCSIGSSGRGMLLPLFLLPRPRLAMLWLGNGVTMAANLVTGRGYAAQGAQTGLTAGFMGIGLSYAIPGYTYYAYIGYALFALTSAEYIQYYPLNTAPIISDISPADGQQNVPLSVSELQFRIQDADLDLMMYQVTTSPFIGSGSGTLKMNGIYSIPIQGLETSTNYTWRVEVSDGKDTTIREYTFTTVLAAPIISNPLPKNNAQFVPIWTLNVSFDLMDYQGDLMNWTVETQPDVGSGAMTGVANGRYSVVISGLEYFTNYIWFVNVTDGVYWMRRAFVFRTTSEGTLVFEPNDDTGIRHNDPNNNFGDKLEMTLRNEYGSGSGWAYDGLIYFDISALPTNASIQYSYLQMYYYAWKDTNPAGRTLRLHPVTNIWDEEVVTWNTQPTYAPQSTSSAIVPSSTGVWMEWDVTADVQAFCSGTSLNYGWKITDEVAWNKPDIPIVRLYTKEQGVYIPLLFVGFEP
ncbi:MAG: DNRLRE domain-containing protein [Candidatus Thermoplasmatota archaeon]